VTIALIMIVRDEAEKIAACIASARPLIDTWRIIDTGSTDGTQEVALEALAGLPGMLCDSEWVNFAHNRSQLLELAHGAADYLLMLDADMELEQLAPLPALTADVGMVRLLGSNLDYALPVLIRGDKEWEYRGYAHSYLAARDGMASRQELRELVIHDHSSTGEEKLLRDVGLLHQELLDKPGDPRATFYLAQSYKDLGMIDEAIAHYLARASLDGFDEERFYALYQAGVLMVEHRSFSEGAELLLGAWRMRPSRAEPLRALSFSAGHVADKIPYPDDILFVHRDCYPAP
jgi:glycosyltransferase involved in cell wall biosynthesis